MSPARIITAKSVENAVRVLLAIDGSTNGVIHLAAIAGRVGVKLDLRRLNELSDTTPVLAAVKPVGDEFYMEDFFAAGGIGAVLGTASTMAAIAEALGMTLPGTAAIPAVHADRLRAAEATGARAVALARSDLTPNKIITAGAIENAARVLLALGGSASSST
jgi:dihydroxyacid dehydratase/phosphogluconate dehydratase